MRTRIWQSVAVGASLSAVLPGTAQAGCADRSILPSRVNLVRVDRATLCLINSERAKRRLAPLRGQRQLSAASARYARELVRFRFFDHVSSRSGDLQKRLERARYVASGIGFRIGENLAWGSAELQTPRAIVNGWMHSPGHRANILSRGFREIGIGVAIGTPTGGSGATYVTDFGARN